ncbi:dethiobiotin synthase [Nitrosococcus wardiae]|uniref:ATP-dependent dethiobiotin synthetase BioD n=1 Tax=Nitrosococcus wardiae TaxID=1814290 RepID=A0A4P7C1Y2_9GAMM|nr:dethiobiotin synthase [Nitrosococcus wardiae]QBQ56391.1 dethiobiotin synthase [Nitrosococcus wardiae]
MGTGLFVTGTDTEVGKTCCSLGLMVCLQRAGYRVAAMKPVASGCQRTAAGLRNEDALLLSQCASFSLDYQQVNPYPLAPPIAPHIAAATAGIEIQPTVIKAAFDSLSTLADKVVVEGIGGWAVPINSKHTMADMAVLLDLPVVLVVGLRLGCLNHALLTAEAISRTGLPFGGWIANRIEATKFAWEEENIETLRERLPAPLLGTVPYLSRPAPERVASFFDLEQCLVAAQGSADKALLGQSNKNG